MQRITIDSDVLNAAIDRVKEVYEQGHRIVVSFSGGKDSTVLLEVCILAAAETGRLPVEVIMRDEEIMFPGTYEYAMRVAKRDEVNFTWLVANQPIINIYNRKEPYFWVFDPMLKPEQWVRTPPDFATFTNDKNIELMTTPKRFPVIEGQSLYAGIGLRVQESRGRLYGIFSSKSHITKPNRYGVRNLRPIYDWTDGDVWKAIGDNGWDYNSAYNVLAKAGHKANELRIAPPTMNSYGARTLKTAADAWPRWFNKVCDRLPGVSAVVKFGMRAVTPARKLGESWEECFYRTCVNDAPGWISERALRYQSKLCRSHYRHSSTPLPEITPCYSCQGNAGSWKNLTLFLYAGDPFSLKTDLPYVEPEFFRKGAGFWNGTPTW